jgi:hypothetical protein
MIRYWKDEFNRVVGLDYKQHLKIIRSVKNVCPQVFQPDDNVGTLVAGATLDITRRKNITSTLKDFR